jgi:hypothetical protein
MLLRRALPYTSAALLVAMIYAGWTMYSRWAEDRRAEEEVAARKREFDQTTLNMIGPDLKILTFYAKNPLICYGVANATRVRIDPPIESITPSLARCIKASPTRTTEYTLTAEDAAGHSVSQTITVKVQ